MKRSIRQELARVPEPHIQPQARQRPVAKSTKLYQRIMAEIGTLLPNSEALSDLVGKYGEAMWEEATAEARRRRISS